MTLRRSHTCLGVLKLLCVCWLTASSAGYALKDLSDRLGFGISYNSSVGAAALSMRYHPDRYYGATGFVSVSAQSGTHNLAVGAKINRNLVAEENSLFFVGLGAMVLSTKTTTSSSTGGELDAFGGVEFFLTGLPNLGIQLEAGVSFRLVDQFAFQTYGGGFASAAIHYYF